MITIKKSPTADSRCCDAKNISKEVLWDSTKEHQRDVLHAMALFSDNIIRAGVLHDGHKLKTMNEFHKAFTGGFIDETWWNEHKKRTSPFASNP